MISIFRKHPSSVFIGSTSSFDGDVIGYAIDASSSQVEDLKSSLSHVSNATEFVSQQLELASRPWPIFVVFIGRNAPPEFTNAFPRCHYSEYDGPGWWSYSNDCVVLCSSSEKIIGETACRLGVQGRLHNQHDATRLPDIIIEGLSCLASDKTMGRSYSDSIYWARSVLRRAPAGNRGFKLLANTRFESIERRGTTRSWGNGLWSAGALMVIDFLRSHDQESSAAYSKGRFCKMWYKADESPPDLLKILIPLKFASEADLESAFKSYLINNK